MIADVGAQKVIYGRSHPACGDIVPVGAIATGSFSADAKADGRRLAQARANRRLLSAEEIGRGQSTINCASRPICWHCAMHSSAAGLAP